MLKKIFFLFLILFSTKTFAAIKEDLIKKLDDTQNITFNFEQNINGKVETGNCTIKYPKKILCKYDSKNEKILVSNGETLVIKTSTSFYLYPIERTPLNFILDKKFLSKKIRTSEERLINEKFVNFKFSQDEKEINIFFDKNNYNLIGWQTEDVYQNLAVTFIYNLQINEKIEEKFFKLPKID